jgi:hypothetical protein
MVKLKALTQVCPPVIVSEPDYNRLHLCEGFSMIIVGLYKLEKDFWNMQ